MLWLLWFAGAAASEVPEVRLIVEADPSVTFREAQFVDRCICRDYHAEVAIRHYELTKGSSRVYASVDVPVKAEVEVTPQRVVMTSQPRGASRPFGLRHRGHDWGCTPEVLIALHTAAFPSWKVNVTGAVPLGTTTMRAEDLRWWNQPQVKVGMLRVQPVEIRRWAEGVLIEEAGQFWFVRPGGGRQRVLDATPALAALVGPVEGHLLPARDGVVVDWLRVPDGSRSVTMVYEPLPDGLTLENPAAKPADPSAPVLRATLRDAGRETTWLAADPPEASG